MLNVDSKIISKATSEKLKEFLPELISSQQTAYVKNIHIGESGRLISIYRNHRNEKYRRFFSYSGH